MYSALVAVVVVVAKVAKVVIRVLAEQVLVLLLQFLFGPMVSMVLFAIAL